jgi:hypothetical protein
LPKPKAIDAQYMPYILTQITPIIIVIKQVTQRTQTLSFTFHNHAKIWKLNDAKILKTKKIQAYDNKFQDNRYFSQNKLIEISGPSTTNRTEKLNAITEK